MIYLVDLRVRDPLRHLALALPREVEQLTELAQVADQQGALHVLGEDLQPIHGVDALDAPRLVVSDLIFDDLVGEVAPAHVGEDEAVLELPDRLWTESERHDQDRASRVELDQVEAAERCRVLVLLAALDSDL